MTYMARRNAFDTHSWLGMSQDGSNKSEDIDVGETFGRHTQTQVDIEKGQTDLHEIARDTCHDVGVKFICC